MIPPNPLWEYELSVTDWFLQTHYGNMNYLLLIDSSKPIMGIWTICYWLFLQTHYGNMNYLLLTDSSKPVMGIWTVTEWFHQTHYGNMNYLLLIIPLNPLWEYELSVTDWFL